MREIISINIILLYFCSVNNDYKINKKEHNKQKLKQTIKTQ